MKLYFIRSNGEKVLVKENISEESVMYEIVKYTESLNPNYKIYYTRSWKDEETGGTKYDIGSHTEFFLACN